MRRKNLRVLGLAGLAVIVAGGLAAFGVGTASSRTDAPTPVISKQALTVTPRPVHSASPTPAPLPKAATVTRPGVPTPPIELEVPFVGGSWPVGLFLLGTHDSPSKKAGAKSVEIDLGVLNEADRPLTIAAAGQYREAVSLWAQGRWKGLLFDGFRTAGGLDVLPSGGGGAADLPPGVWGQVHLIAEIDAADSVAEVRVGLTRDHMTAYPLTAATLQVTGQPWAAAGAAATPIVVTATPVPTSR